VSEILQNIPGKDEPINAHLVLVEPLIPGNTGSLARLCAGARMVLHLIEPLGFEMNHRQVKRAGLDYWPNIFWARHPSLEQCLSGVPRERIFLFSAKGGRRYSDIDYRPQPWLVFGKETTGFSPELRGRYEDCLVRVPITEDIRSLNLANVASIAAYEALRQLDFPGIEANTNTSA
jgi:tRNA (cytidine/uridine-2'-O-)-methyltransferase